MQKLTAKLALIGAVCLVFFIGLMFISGLVRERQSYHQSVIDEIKTAHVKHQYLLTPFLVVEADTGERLVFPNQSNLNITASVKDDEYSRGIYHAISYHATINAKQSFELPLATTPKPSTPNPNTQADGTPTFPSANTQATNTPPPPNANGNAKDPTPKRLTLFISASDLRGLTAKEVLIDGKSYPTKFAKESKFGMNYLAVDLTSELGKTTLNSDLTLSLSGIDSLNLLPLGADFATTLTSNWHEPKFFGQALPIQKTILETGEGFNASWQGGFIATQNESLMHDCASGGENGNCPIFEQMEHSNYQSFGAAFVQMNDTYTQTDRSIKYALLLIMVSFGTFFLCEVIKGRAIHPIQYLLVASALLVFYLLLLSLAEQIAFLYAYVIASIACVGLIGWYACYMLGSVLRGMGFGLVLGSLYACFYVILSASGLNLLMGSVFCFVCIAVVMAVTRHVDWYDIYGDKDESDDTPTLQTQGT